MMTSSRVLILTNDDGIDEPGLAALSRACEGLGHRVTIAPVGPKSSCGHAVTTHRDVLITGRGDGRYAVEGTPADCVRLGLHHLAAGAEWVIAGINAGGNLGADVHHSGTVAAAREAVLHGRPAVALSHYIARGRAIDWDHAEVLARRVLRDLLARPWEPGTLWNVNLPHPAPGSPEPRIVACRVDPSPLPLSFRVDAEGLRARYDGDYQGRARIAGGDVDVCFRGDIAISCLRLLADDHTPSAQDAPGSRLAGGGVGRP